MLYVCINFKNLIMKKRLLYKKSAIAISTFLYRLLLQVTRKLKVLLGQRELEVLVLIKD